MVVDSCICGTMILPNAANQCSSFWCNRTTWKGSFERVLEEEIWCFIRVVDAVLIEKTPGNFKDIALESPKLMAICLEHIPDLTSSESESASPKSSLVDAVFVWTEPNSMRPWGYNSVWRFQLKFSMFASNRQWCVVEFVIQLKQCPNYNCDNTNR